MLYLFLISSFILLEWRQPQEVLMHSVIISLNTNLTQKLKACNVNWEAHLLFDNGKEKVSVTMFDPVLQNIFKYCNIDEKT